MSAYACYSLEFMRIKNVIENISIVTLSRQDCGSFKIPAACFHFAAIRLPFSGKFLSNFLRHITHSAKKSMVVTGVNSVTKLSSRKMATKLVGPLSL